MTVRSKLINRRYRLERRIALDDSSETWLGFDNVLHRAVAVSMPRQEFLRNGPFLVQFLQRSRIATALHHRGIVAAFDSGEHGDTPYLVTEYLSGESLSNIIRAESPFDVDDVAILVEQVASALDYAHQRGFVHSSLGPGHVLVDRQGTAKLIGLGLPIGTTVAGGSALLLTVENDIRGLAAIAFEMLTGEEPDAVDAGSPAEAYLIDPEVPRNASDIVAVGLGAGSTQFATAGAFSRSLSDWKAFDPGEFFIAPEPHVFAPNDSEPISTSSARFSAESFPQFDPANESTGIHPDSAPVAASHRHIWAMLAVLALALTAGAIVWMGNEQLPSPTSQLESGMAELARLSGF